MRVDKLTTKFRESLEQAQSLALGSDHAYIEPPHLVLAMLDQQDGPRALLERAGVQIDALRQAARDLMNKLPQVQGQEQVQVGRDLVSLLQAAEKEGIKRDDAFIASELFFLALCDHKGDMAQAARGAGLSRKALEMAIAAVRGRPRLRTTVIVRPDIDPYVLRQMKADPELRTIPVVMLTSSREESDLVQSYHAGVNAYVVKPVDFQQYLDAVRQLGQFWAHINEPPPAPVRLAA